MMHFGNGDKLNSPITRAGRTQVHIENYSTPYVRIITTTAYLTDRLRPLQVTFSKTILEKKTQH